ncbi:MAG TPA: DUF3575 domain-containing protein, partial [Puia sp.]|nr:DUF3575 domain-containing protein [Puia sp.]
MRTNKKILAALAILFALGCPAMAQDSTATHQRTYKNVIRYDLSGGLLFGFGKYVVFGYERVLGPHQSMSVNIGPASLPRLLSIETDSFSVSKDTKRKGFNVSVDYRFYLAKENKYGPPRGLYIGPYISYNQFERNNEWNYNSATSPQQVVHTTTEFKILTLGGEIGYQFVIWKRLAIDMVMIGPGFSHYDLHSVIHNTLSERAKEQIQSAIKQLITQRFPGMNYVFSDKQFDANGRIRTWDVGYRY